MRWPNTSRTTKSRLIREGGYDDEYRDGTNNVRRYAYSRAIRDTDKEAAMRHRRMRRGVDQPASDGHVLRVMQTGKAYQVDDGKQFEAVLGGEG